MRKEISLENGRLIVEAYPTKQQFLEEAARDDCSSWLMLHVEFAHDEMTTLELYNLLQFDFHINHLSKYFQRKLIDKNSKEGKLSIDLIDHFDLPELRPEQPLEMRQKYFCEQISFSLGETSRFYYNLWIDFCKHILKRKAKHGKFVDGKEVVYNPYEGLRLKVRMEFHD
jgi:hypothetical protein